MIIDCDTCTAGPHACADCVVSFLTVAPRAERDLAAEGWPPAATVGAGLDAAAPVAVELDSAEERALGVLAASGLVPPLRMTTPRRRTG